MVDRGRLGLGLDYAKKLGFVDPCIRYPAAPSTKAQSLPENFEPGNWDVICQGGKESYDHIGNRRFRICIDNNLRTYSKAKSKHERSSVVTCIVDVIREMGSFVRKDESSGCWFEVDDKTAREKVGHALRDAIKALDKTKLQKKHAGPDSHSESSTSKKRKITEPVAAPATSSPGVPAPNKPLQQNTHHISEDMLPPNTVKNPEQSVLPKSFSQGVRESDDCDTHSDAGDSVLNEMAQETMLDDSSRVQPAESLSFNPPGFSSFEAEYM
eukprot:CAMPEP_0176007336 /NCGR_PEP_ID=MMETSP0120_2-20121206/3181_1 /TAXON_ID=160619 /ORGANISM="Kryptoperidinium foliaceum, Strain CCMP 1326" /LENGTH=268 /DNA_ID=CAMNT_0017340095 /DNA_START=37 /DNA_END=840 /DNA_ORIENTATION=+